MSTASTRELFDRCVVPTYARFDLRLARGQGTYVWDEDGKRYLDFGAGIAVTSIGHCHPRVVAVMREQIGKVVHVSNLYYSRPQGLLAERLVRLVGAPGKVFFCNSGAEANEALYKLARKFGNESEPPPPQHTVGEMVEPCASRHTVVTMLASFHGRTLAGIAATGQEKVKVGFEPAVEGFFHVPFNDGPALLEAVHEPNVVAILLEPIQGERGIYPADAKFLQLARDLCDRHGLLLFFDEVQCGLGRTGEWCGWRSLNPDVTPDAVSWAKGIAGGFPLGAVWISDRPVRLKTGETKPLCDLLGPGSHGTTFGGTPLVSVGANEVLAVIEEEGMLANARATGAQAKVALCALGSPLIKEVRGIGLLIGLQLSDDFAQRAGLPDSRYPSLFLVEQLHEAGLLTVPSGAEAIRWLPPLNVRREEIDQAVEILRGVLAKFT
jgi:acetylornithine/N-succinyldiaminopimelate aminotransferase